MDTDKIKIYGARVRSDSMGKVALPAQAHPTVYRTRRAVGLLLSPNLILGQVPGRSAERRAARMRRRLPSLM